MAQRSIQGVDQGDDYWHVRYRDPDDFDEIRTPDWAENVADSVVSGGKVRTGDEHGNEDWTAQSVLVPLDGAQDQDEAADMADQIIGKMES